MLADVLVAWVVRVAEEFHFNLSCFIRTAWLVASADLSSLKSRGWPRHKSRSSGLESYGR